MFPIENYTFHVVPNQNLVVAISSFAGKAIKATAKCHPEDAFDLEFGKRLAATKCANKIAKKRMARAERKIKEAQIALEKAREHYKNMEEYYDRAERDCAQYKNELEKLMKNPNE